MSWYRQQKQKEVEELRNLKKEFGKKKNPKKYLKYETMNQPFKHKGLHYLDHLEDY